MIKDFYIYGVAFASLAAGTTQTPTLTIQADADFEIQKLAFTADISGAVTADGTRVIPQCTLILTDTGSGRQLMNTGIDLPTFFGTGQEPFILPVPKILRANTALSVALTNYSSASTYNVHLSFIGNKRFA